VLTARDAYHVHLVNQPNVVGTAVGKYLARLDELGDDPLTLDERLELTPGLRGRRTLEGSRVMPWSWPCVLVFVDGWMTADEIAENPDAMVPRRLYLPDGLVVPTCVVYAPLSGTPPDDTQHLSFPTALLGGGFVCLAEVQGTERAGSIACLVTDGDKVFALTNRHVAGPPGRQLYTMVDGAYVPIGTTVEPSARRLPFEDVYPGFPGERIEVAIDAGLVEVENLDSWTTQVYGVGELEEIVDVSPEALSLDWIGLALRAFGAASGPLEGELVAFYYRYKTRSGIEYVADALVGPRGSDPLTTQPGDSGTLWVVEPEASQEQKVPRVRPIGMQWGGHRFVGDGVGSAEPYALVTFVSNVCRALDVEVVYDWNLGHDLYWGEAGHYTIGAKACDLVSPAGLRDFFVANRSNVSFDLDAIRRDEFHTGMRDRFYPLADVPDLVWKLGRGEDADGNKLKKRPHEGPNHFADMDEPGPDGRTLLELFDDDHASLTPERWIAFYRSIGKTPKSMGLLPFRVGQLYQVIVDSLTDGRPQSLERALAAAGVMAHYVGDACQPLHISQFHDGRPGDPSGVHTAYETTMIVGKRRQVVDGLRDRLRSARPRVLIDGRAAAAVATASLMRRTFATLEPDEIIDAWKSSSGPGRTDQMWTALGSRTLSCLADGCRTLATLWSSAWAEAGAPVPPAQALDRSALAAIYVQEDFARSMYLTEHVGGQP